MLCTWALLFSLMGFARGYSMGAPDSACDSMTPGHGVAPQTTIPPYTVTPNVTSVFVGGGVAVLLRGSNGATFEGFLVQGRDPATQRPLGTFVTTSDKLLICGAGYNNAATHRDKAVKTSVQLEWFPPSDYEGDVVFRGTFVERYERFWVGATSEKVRVQKRSTSNFPQSLSPGAGSSQDTTVLVTLPARPTTTHAPTTPELPVTTRVIAQAASQASNALRNIYEGCNRDKGCLGLPSNCVTKKNCEMLMTYTVSSGRYQFELSGQESQYAAGALSFDAQMGGDSVMVCRSSNGQVDVVMAWNEGRDHQRLVDPNQGIRDKRTAQVDGQIYCSFVRDDFTRINGEDFDLWNNKFFLLVAKGPVSSDGRISYHGRSSRLATNTHVSLSDFSRVKERDLLFTVLHASLMIGAWVSTASCGIMIARYFKQTWLESRCMNIDLWFHWHRFFMILTWSLNIAALVLIAYDIGGVSAIPITDNPHTIIGIISIGLCFIQPFMALCRPKPGAKNRSIFNWSHWLVGNSAQILGITAIFFGFQLFLRGDWVPWLAFWILIAFVVFHCIFHLVLSIGQCVTDSRSNHSDKIFPLKDLSTSRSFKQEEKRQDAPGSVFRKIFLALYLIGNWVLTAALILLIVFGEEQLEKWNINFWEKL